MTERLSELLDAVSAGRRPTRNKIDPQDAPLVRTAIELRAVRPGEDSPREDFVADLHRRLAAEAAEREAAIRPRRARPSRLQHLVGVAAASAALMGGTAAVTVAITNSSTVSVASHVPSGDAMRTGTFQRSDGQVLGQIVAYRGKPSWVFMNVTVPRYEGTVTCELQTADGATVAYGSFPLQGGVGQFSNELAVDIAGLRGARLVDASGAVIASATFT